MYNQQTKAMNDLFYFPAFNGMKKITACLLFVCLCACAPDSPQNPVITLTDDQYPLNDSLLVEISELHRKAAKARDYSALEKATAILVRHYNCMSDYKPAFLLVNDYLEIVSASGESALIPPALYYTGVVYFNCGLPNYSIDYFLKIIDYPIDEKWQCKVYYAMGENSRNLIKDNEMKPMEYYLKAEALARKLNDSLLIASALFGQSQMLFESLGSYKVEKMSDGMKDSLARSTRLLEEAAVYRGAPDPIYTARLSLNHAAMGLYDKALSYRETIESFRSVPMFTALTFNCMAAVSIYMKDYDEAIRLGKEAYQFAKEKQRKFDIHHAADIMTYAYKANGDYKNALLNFEIVHQSEEEMRKTESDMEVLALQVKYDLKVKEQLIARQQEQLLWSIAIIGLIVAGLLLVTYFYRKTRAAYRELVVKNQQWAGAGSVEKADSATEGPQQPSPSTTPDLMDNLIMEDIQKQIAECIYKNPDLTLELFAKKIDSNPTYVSNAINRCTGKNFKTYLNEYRVKDAIRILSDELAEDISIDELAEGVGFNDRKNFYRVFKKITGLSPTDFKKNRIRK
jgi:AraC-like DNA-binding protein